MGQPIDPTMMGPVSPVTGDMIMALRREAMQSQGMMPPDQSGAANRRLNGQGTQGQQIGQDPAAQQVQGDPNNPLEQGKTPTQVQLDDMEAAQQDQIGVPDIPQDAAKVMMQYGAVLDFLREAKGQIQQ